MFKNSDLIWVKYSRHYVVIVDIMFDNYEHYPCQVGFHNTTVQYPDTNSTYANTN